MLRSAILILCGNASASAMLLARNLIIARLISVENYGIAATFAIAMAVVEMMSALGLQQQIVQAKDGEDMHFQAALQGFQVLRGIIAGVILFIAAGSIAQFLNIPDVAWAYQVMALVPIFNAFQHFDIYRLNRSMKFWPIVLTGAVPALISLILVWPLYLLFGDYQVMLWSIIIQIALMMIVSHAVAERPYKLAFDPKIMKASFKFGWPILVNGILMFAVFNGDKLIVGRAIGIETLAIFAMGITLTLTPTLVMAKSLQNFFLPQLSQLRQTDLYKFNTLSVTVVEVALLIGVVLVVGMVTVGQPIIYLLLGEKYVPLLSLLTWLAILQGIRVFKEGPSAISMAAGQNENSMFANAVRVATLPLAWYFATQTGDVKTIIFIGIIGEILAQTMAITLLHLRTGCPLKPLLRPHLGAGIVLVSASLYEVLPSLTTGIILGLSICAFLLMLSEARGYISRRASFLNDDG